MGIRRKLAAVGSGLATGLGGFNFAYDFGGFLYYAKPLIDKQLKYYPQNITTYISSNS